MGGRFIPPDYANGRLYPKAFFVLVDGYTISWHQERADAEAAASKIDRAIVIQQGDLLPPTRSPLSLGP